MELDKRWIQIIDRTNPSYHQGVGEFLEFAFRSFEEGKLLRCPCKTCNNINFLSRKEIYEHLITIGIKRDYILWEHHGEKGVEYDDDSDNDDGCNQNCDDGLQEMLLDLRSASNIEKTSRSEETSYKTSPSGSQMNEESNNFYTLLQDAEQELYPGCENFSKLSFIVQLINIKCLFGLSANAIDAILSLLTKAFPKGNKVPESYFETRKVIRELGLDYIKIDACLNDCILYRGDYANSTFCPNCGDPRYIDPNKKVPQKVLRYFPLAPRLQRLYMSSSVAKEMRWHKDKSYEDGEMRHPSDSFAWKDFDSKHETFAKESRNVRLGLASDGFNPFGNMSTLYTVWPVVLIPYNLPPWMCMKDPNFIMSLLIPGPKAPGNDIDVYLQPLIDELKELWEKGVKTYDASSKEMFQLHASILWTINDFPAYANLSGWSTKGKLGCPCCHMDTCSLRLPNGRKYAYMGSRRFLPLDHSWRNKAKAFDGNKETRSEPHPLSGDDIVEQYRHFDRVKFGKSKKKRKRGEIRFPGNWKKKSVFFELPYWRCLKLRHNLDVMHIEKNICENIIGTLLDLEGKTKDNLKTRFDLEHMGIRPELHATKIEEGTYTFQPACYTMSSEEKRAFCQLLLDMKVPDGYSSNISRCINVKEKKIQNMKCHDYHVFLHRYLPLSIRGVLQKDVSEALIELSFYFRELCSKTLTMENLEFLGRTIVVTLCKLEKLFPPSFFTIMVHLSIHLIDEAKNGGSVQYRWMYPIERYLRRLKSYVRNKARVEGSIAEAYIAQECVHFCSRYLHGVETSLNRSGRNFEGDLNQHNNSKLSCFSHAGKPLLGKKYVELNSVELEQARTYVVKNCDEVSPFIKLHKEELQKENPHHVEQRHEKEFHQWFKNHVTSLKREMKENIYESLLNLAYGPDSRVYRYTSYLINGWRFNIKDRDALLKSQNSGVFVKGDENAGNLDYFGVLTDIIELSYLGTNNVILFKCDWWDVASKGRGYKKDEYGFFLINQNQKLKTNEPYVLATQVEQVYYVKDTKDPNWAVVVKTKPRDLYDMPEKTTNEACQENDEIGSIPSASYSLDNDRVVLLDRSDLVVSTANGSPVVPTEVDEEESDDDDDENFDIFKDEGNSDVDIHDSDDDN